MKAAIVTLHQAIQAQVRYCQRKGHVFQQPSEVLSTVTPERIVLKNARGEIARFNIGKRGRLVRTKD